MRLQMAAAEKPVRYRLKSWLVWYFRFFGIFGPAFGGWLIWVGATAGYGGSTPSYVRATGVLSLAGGVVMLGLGSLLLLVLVRPQLILTAEAVRIPRGFRTTSVPLQDIAGVGLVFKRNHGSGSRIFSGWYLMVWRSDGRGERTAIGYFPKAFRNTRRGHGRSWSFSAANSDPVAATDVAQLSSTPAAQVARDLYDRILSHQGPSGPLAVQQLQKHVHAGGPWESAPIVASWSPDGVIAGAGA